MKKSSGNSNAESRPPFTIVDWIIAAFSIIALIVILLNLPDF